ncbi:MAG: beta-ketoacyl-[acyl-carrier-protein] synthase family protein [Caldilineaceae bacterium]
MSTIHSKPNEQRVVITGMGIVTTLGENLEEYRCALQAGRSGVTTWKTTEERGYSKIGGDMSGFDIQQHLATLGNAYPPHLTKAARKLLRKTPLAGSMTTAAALQAYVDAGLSDQPLPPERIGHTLAGHNLNMPYICKNEQIFQQEPEDIDALFGLLHVDTDILAAIAELLNLRGPCFSVGGACASGNLALLSALDQLRAGRAEVMVVSGAPHALTPVVLQGWAMLQVIAMRSFNERPAEASRPFDRRREGFVPSEGAGAVVLETLASAQRRGVRIYGELLGAASTSNASRLPHPDVEAQVRVMQNALDDAGAPREAVDYINAHATSTEAGDAVEVEAIKQLFGARAYTIPVNATKSLVGHCLTAAGLVELIAVLLQMQHNFLHPTINLTDPDPALDLDFVPNQARPYAMQLALSNAFGFGGLNACVAVGRMAN